MSTLHTKVSKVTEIQSLPYITEKDTLPFIRFITSVCCITPIIWYAFIIHVFNRYTVMLSMYSHQQNYTSNIFLKCS